MWITMLTAFVVLAAFLFFWIVFYKKEDSDNSSTVRYSCHQCNEKNCNCSEGDGKVK